MPMEKFPCLIGNASSNGPFCIVMLVYLSVGSQNGFFVLHGRQFFGDSSWEKLRANHVIQHLSKTRVNNLLKIDNFGITSRGSKIQDFNWLRTQKGGVKIDCFFAFVF